MSKNVNNEVTMNPPIQNYAYPDDHAPAAAYDRILQFPSLQSRKAMFVYGCLQWVGNQSSCN